MSTAIEWTDVTDNIIVAKGGGRDIVDCVLPLADKKGGDMSEWPAELRVREFPAERGCVPPAPKTFGAGRSDTAALQ